MVYNKYETLKIIMNFECEKIMLPFEVESNEDLMHKSPAEIRNF